MKKNSENLTYLTAPSQAVESLKAIKTWRELNSILTDLRKENEVLREIIKKKEESTDASIFEPRTDLPISLTANETPNETIVLAKFKFSIENFIETLKNIHINKKGIENQIEAYRIKAKYYEYIAIMNTTSTTTKCLFIFVCLPAITNPNIELFQIGLDIIKASGISMEGLSDFHCCVKTLDSIQPEVLSSTLESSDFDSLEDMIKPVQDHYEALDWQTASERISEARKVSNDSLQTALENSKRESQLIQARSSSKLVRDSGLPEFQIASAAAFAATVVGYCFMSWLNS